MVNDKTYLILDGIEMGDQIGGPSELAKIFAESLKINNGFNEKDLTTRYLDWWKKCTSILVTYQVFSIKLKKV